MSNRAEAPSIGDYGLIGDCHGSALISSAGSIDWCCMPRMDSGSCFGRILDRERGGYCAITIEGGARTEERGYVADTLVLETVLEAPQGTVRLRDFMAMREHGAQRPRGELIRIAECERGSADVRFELAPRFDYGTVRPWLRRTGSHTFAATGGADGLLMWSDGEPDIQAEAVTSAARLRSGERLRLAIRCVRPHLLEHELEHEPLDPGAIDARLDETIDWWCSWRERLAGEGSDRRAVVRSALTLKALAYAPTGAIAAAPTTSLPEVLGGERNWDYRYSWVRDSTLAARTLAELGCEREAERSRRFIVRSSAGHAEDLQIVFGIGGERRIPELDLDLDGYRDSRPVRIGNGASGQLQLDAFGEILNLAWRWHRRGRSPEDDEWRFFAELVETAAERWSEPDRGIWEWRGEPRHVVHSKACCWAALDRGLRLAEECARPAPRARWTRARDEIREAIEQRGYDAERGVFVQCFDEAALDAALLLLPVAGFVGFDDERMLRTADAVREELSAGDFLYRYRQDDELPGQEGAFLACSFWLAECYARQDRVEDAREVFDRALGAASPLGLFSEEVDPDSGELLGNYPQALTHLSHVAAASALAEAERRPV